MRHDGDHSPEDFGKARRMEDEGYTDTLRPATATATRTLPIVEVFGPTIQGEGALAGLPTMFVRLGYCDYRCEFCDSMYAVDPRRVKENAESLTELEVMRRLIRLHKRDWIPGMWVTLSGGNPAIHDLGHLVHLMHVASAKVAVETQGSVWRDWLRDVDHLTVSPKPPSSGMVSHKHRKQTDKFLDKAQTWVPRDRRSIKIVIFDQADLDWAKQLVRARRATGAAWDVFLSVGTDQPGQFETETFLEAAAAAREHGATLQAISDRYRWLCEKVAGDPVFVDVRVLPQLHVIAFGHMRGV